MNEFVLLCSWRSEWT